LQRRASICHARIRLSSISAKRTYGMIKDVIHISGAEHGVDGYPDKAGADECQNSALTNSTELLQMVEIFSPGLSSARHQIIGKAIGVALELGEGHAPLRRL